MVRCFESCQDGTSLVRRQKSFWILGLLTFFKVRMACDFDLV